MLPSRYKVLGVRQLAVTHSVVPLALPHLLRGAVGFQECIHLMLELHGKRVAAGEYALQLAEIQILGLLEPQQGFIEGGNAAI